MRSDRRMAFTFGNSTFVTRMPGTFRPPACAAACCRLAINSFPNLLMLSSSFAFALEQLGELADAALLLRRQVFAPSLGIGHQQVKRVIRVVIEIDLPCAAHPGNHISRFWIGGDELHEGLAFRVVPNLRRLAHEHRSFHNGDEARGICQCTPMAPTCPDSQMRGCGRLCRPVPTGQSYFSPK